MSASAGSRLALGHIFADPAHHLAVLVKGPHQDQLRGNNFGLIAALEGLKQSFFGVSKPRRNHVEPWEVRVIFNAHTGVSLTSARPKTRPQPTPYGWNRRVISVTLRQQSRILEPDNVLDAIGPDDFDARQCSAVTLQVDFVWFADHMNQSLKSNLTEVRPYNRR